MLFQSAESRYNQWVREHYRFLLRSAWALTGSRAIAEDVVQDCFANAWKHREQLRDAALARAWLFQIMRRAAFRQAAPSMQSLDDEEQPEQAAPDAGLDTNSMSSRRSRAWRPSTARCWCCFISTTCPPPRWPRRWRSRPARCCRA